MGVGCTLLPLVKHPPLLDPGLGENRTLVQIGQWSHVTSSYRLFRTRRLVSSARERTHRPVKRRTWKCALRAGFFVSFCAPPIARAIHGFSIGLSSISGDHILWSADTLHFLPSNKASAPSPYYAGVPTKSHPLVPHASVMSDPSETPWSDDPNAPQIRP